jgi:hypothetical protein
LGFVWDLELGIWDLRPMIQTDAQLQELLPKLAAVDRIAVDTEAAGGMGAGAAFAQSHGRAAADRGDGKADRQFERDEDECGTAPQRTKMKIPNPKSQIPRKSQISNGEKSQRAALGLANWDLELGTSLGFGVWDFGFSK